MTKSCGILAPSIGSQHLLSDRFPVYPLSLTLSAKGEPFSTLELCCLAGHLPSRASIQLSDDGDHYDRVGELRFLDEPEKGREFRIRSLRLGKTVSAQYVRISIEGAVPSSSNPCRQVAVAGVACYQPRFADTQYLYNLEVALEHPRGLLELLQCLEWNKLQAKAESNFDLCIQNQEESQRALKLWHEAKSAKDAASRVWELEQQLRTRAAKYRQDILKSVAKPEPKQQPQFLIGEAVRVVQNWPVSERIRAVFGQHPKVSERMMKLLASDLEVDKEKFILEVWALLKDEGGLSAGDESLLLDSALFLLESKDTKLVSLVLQVLGLAMRKSGMGKAEEKYERLVERLMELYLVEDLSPLPIQKTLLTLFPAMDPSRYLDVLMNRPGDQFDMLRLTLCNQIVRHNQLPSYAAILNFAKKLFKHKGLSRDRQELAVEVLTAIARRIGLSHVMDYFADLPTHVMLNVEKLVKEGLGKPPLASTNVLGENPQLPQPVDKCQYCHQQDPSFLDADLYDLHCFKDCVFLHKCDFCENVVEIPHLPVHYVKECKESRNFKKCGQCGTVLHRLQSEAHDQVCLKKPVTVCPLCDAVFVEKEELTHHILGRECPKNQRALQGKAPEPAR